MKKKLDATENGNGDFAIVKVSEQKVPAVKGGTRSQYRINIPARFVDRQEWKPQQRIMITAGPNGSVILTPFSPHKIKAEG